MTIVMRARRHLTMALSDVGHAHHWHRDASKSCCHRITTRITPRKFPMGSTVRVVPVMPTEEVPMWRGNWMMTPGFRIVLCYMGGARPTCSRSGRDKQPRGNGSEAQCMARANNGCFAAEVTRWRRSAVMVRVARASLMSEPSITMVPETLRFERGVYTMAKGNGFAPARVVGRARLREVLEESVGFLCDSAGGVRDSDNLETEAVYTGMKILRGEWSFSDALSLIYVRHLGWRRWLCIGDGCNVCSEKCCCPAVDHDNRLNCYRAWHDCLLPE